MIREHFNLRLDGKFILTIGEPYFDWKRADHHGMIHILWNQSDVVAVLEVDGFVVEMPPGSVMTTTYYHCVEVTKNAEALAIFSFNREYYCVYDHDAEISCNGIIFFGAQDQLVLRLDEEQQNKLELLLSVFIDEFKVNDNVQGEMLVILLKRLIILCTRVAKKQEGLNQGALENVELIRHFNYLVDKHFRMHKSVKEYADLMHKSPKTLSNVFAKAGKKSPLQLIHSRIVLEARRQLTYTDKSISEIAYDLGYEEPASFFKLFKKQVNQTPQSFRIAAHHAQREKSTVRREI